MDSTFEVIVSSPLGDLPGKAVVNLEGKKLCGMLNLLAHDNPFTGTLDGETLAFSGDLKTPVGSMAYTVIGTLKDGKIDAVAKTKIGELKIRSR